MKSQILLASLILFSLQGMASAQEPESKPASKPAPDKAKKADEEKSEATPIHHQIGKDLANIKELKAFLKSFDKSATALLEGKAPDVAFPNIEVKSWDSKRRVDTWEALETAGAAKLALLGVDIMIEVAEGENAGVGLKVRVISYKGQVYLVPDSVNEPGDKFIPRGLAEKDIDKTFAFIRPFATALLKKASGVKDSKKLPFVQEDDFEALGDLVKKGITREEWKAGINRGLAKQSKLFLKLKAVASSKVTLNIDEAMLRVEDKDGKLLGLLAADFHLNKKACSVQFRTFLRRD